MTEGIHESCGVFGIFGDEHAAEKTYLGLYALQHRGQESAGISVSDGHVLSIHKGMGLVRTVFNSHEILRSLKGFAAIGHNRYSTEGESKTINAQPLLIQFRGGQIAGVHNGNLVNALELRKRMENTGSIFQTTSDSEIVLHLIARSEEQEIVEMIYDALKRLDGAFSFLFLTPERLIAARDPYGFRPLCLGRSGDAVVVASETCAFDIIGAQYTRSIEPGEIVVVSSSGIESRMLPTRGKNAMCIFEYIYFSRPDSIIFNDKVDKIRRRLGKTLAREAPVEADIVIAIPDSANTAALGYAQASNLRFEIGLIRNHYVGRTFIDPEQGMRDIDVKVKFNPVTGVLNNKRVVVVDDSIVRGTTLRQLVKIIRGAGAKEVHVRISSPPVISPCYYGIDISRSGELIASSKSVDEICNFIGADSLAYLSVEGMLGTVSESNSFCTACFTGRYPTPVPQNYDKMQLGMNKINRCV